MLVIEKEKHLQTFQLHLFHFLPRTENKETLVMPSATGKLRRGELGRGRNRAPDYKVTRDNQSPLELSWHWRHRTQQTADQWVSLGRKRKEEGSRAGYCTKKSVPRWVQITPKVVGDPVTCSDVLVWMFAYLFWPYANATPNKDLALEIVLQITMTVNGCPTIAVVVSHITQSTSHQKKGIWEQCS